MISKKMIVGFLVVFVAISCTKDEIIDESEPSFLEPNVSDKSLEKEMQFSDKSRIFRNDLDPDSNEDFEKPLLDLSRTPLCTGDGVYYPVRVTYSNFPSDSFTFRTLDISYIRTRYNYHYNQGDCQLVLFPNNSGSITCEGETCSEIWYFFGFYSKPDGGGTLNIDVEAPGP